MKHCRNLGRILLQSLVAIVLLTSMTACGFHLKGHGAQAQVRPWNTLTVSGGISNKLNLALQDRLLIGGIQQQETSPYKLTLRNEKRLKRSISLNSRAQTAEYRLSHQVDIELINTETSDTILPTRRLEAQRTFVYRTEEADGMDQQEQELRTEMANELANRILRAINNLQAPSEQ